MDSLQYFELLEKHRSTIIYFETARQIYLEKGLDIDWVNNRFDSLISREDKCLERQLNMMRAEHRRHTN